MLYLFVLGRDPELSKIEVESVLDSKNIKFRILDESRDVLLIEIDNINPEIIEEFGGLIKISIVISNTNKYYEIENNLEKTNLYDGKSNKIDYYINAYNTNLLSFVEDFLKDHFRSLGLKALYRKSGEPSKLVSRDVINKGIDLVIYKSIIGKTIAISNPKEFKKRDLGRPEVDYMRVVSIRLAKILVNISQVKKNETLLDPYCGAGTVIQEALLKKINALGIDKDEYITKQAEKNLNWFVKTYNIKNTFRIFNGDCINLNKFIKKDSINGVVTEPYMGPYIRKLPTINEAKKLVLELSVLYKDLFKNLKNVVKKGARVVIIIPKFRTRENKKIFLDFRSIYESNDFSLVYNPIKYGYKENKLLREIYVLEKN